MRVPWPLLSLCLLQACVFQTEPGLDRPRTHYDFARVEALENPLARWYPSARGKNVVGLQFAFTSVDYEKEIDSNIDAFAREAGGEPAVVGAYFDLSKHPEDLRRFLVETAARGAVPFVTLDPKDRDEPDVAYQRTFIALINAGKFDSSLSAQAAAIRDFGSPVLLRFAHEMNGDWYPYSGVFAGGAADADHDGLADGPENFVKAWRRVHGLFAAAGVANAVWIFCPNAETFPAEEWNLPFAYYPGSAYVDMITVDAYEAPYKARRDLEAVTEDFFNELGLFLESGAEAKPVGISEFGTSRAGAADKGDWYESALRYLASDRRVGMSLLFNAKDGAKDFSITGLGERLRPGYGDARFGFRFPEATPAIIAGAGAGPAPSGGGE